KIIQRFFYMSCNFLPMTKKEMTAKGWDHLDVIIITGDPYIDHHANGAAVIGRILESAGYRVGIIARPDWRQNDDFMKLGEPRLFFAVSSGGMDSMVCNYTANKKPRKSLQGQKPDRAVIAYTNKIKENFKNIPIIIGGIEASMRRLAHYDYWDNKVRRSLLLDSKADILVYGMGDRQIVEIAKRLDSGEPVKNITNIRGTVVLANNCLTSDFYMLPSYEEIIHDKENFNKSFALFYNEQEPNSAKPLVQKYGNRFIIHNPPNFPLEPSELDKIFELPYQNTWHPFYDRQGGIKNFESVKFSITASVGCPGECSFCSISIHQGRIVQSRTLESIYRQAKKLTQMPDFRGTITDIGGATANLYLSKCEKWNSGIFCKNKNCLIPTKCKNLKLGYDECIDLYKKILDIPKVKHVFIGSGLRYDLLIDEESQEYLEQICRHHISGRMKIAPEHTVEKVLKFMGKPSFDIYKKFVKRFNKVVAKMKKPIFLVNYFIVSHPGSDLNDALNLGLYCVNNKIHPEQIQDFIPLPMSIASCMYYTGFHPLTREKVYAPKDIEERNMQRALVQYRNNGSKKFVIRALKRLGKFYLVRRFYKI
ncbi:YgiQ family radical SAM protein, partial [bacterium]